MFKYYTLFLQIINLITIYLAKLFLYKLFILTHSLWFLFKYKPLRTELNFKTVSWIPFSHKLNYNLKNL